MDNIALSYVTNLLGDGSVSSLLGGRKNSSLLTAEGFENVLSSRYIDQPAATVEFSSGLKAFIEENVSDEGKRASLLASLEAIGTIGQGSITGKTISALFTKEQNETNGLLDLFV